MCAASNVTMLNLRIAFTMGLLALGLALPAHAAFIGYLKLPDIEGESEAAGFEGWIAIDGFNYTIDSPPSEFPTLDRVKILKRLDKTSPQIFNRTVNNTALNDVELVIQGPNPDTGELITLFTYEFNNCRITSITSELVDGELVEIISLTPAEFSITYEETGASMAYDFSMVTR